MGKLLVLAILLVSAIKCTKEQKLSRLDDYNLTVSSWDLVDEIEGVKIELAFRLHVDNEGILWVGTYGNGLIRIGNEVESYTTNNSTIPNDTIWALTTDRNGILWGGTVDGLFKFDGAHFEVYDTSNSEMVLNHVIAIAVDESNNIWFSNGNSHEGGLMRFNQSEEWTLFTPDNSSLPSRIVNTIHVDKEGTVWTGHGMWMGAGGIWTRDISGIEKNYTINNSNLNYNWISRIEGDNNGNIWIGTNAPIFLNSDTLYGGVQVFNNNDFISYNPSSSGHATNRVECMDFDDVGNLWVSTGLDAPTNDLKNEVSIFNNSNWLVFSKEIRSFPNLRVTDIKIHGETVWMATASGLLQMKLQYE